MSEDFEELEQIPWAALAATPTDARTRYLTIAIGVVFAVGVIGWLLMRGPGPTATLATTLPAATIPPAAADTAAPEPVPAEPEPVVYTEADLMLIDVGDEERLAVMHAEWLIRDYLTVDGDAATADRIGDLLPDGAEPDQPPTYVEWVEAFSVATPEAGRYLVEVVYRVLVDDGDGFVRRPAAGMVVDLAVDTDGSARLLAVPEPVAVPELRRE
ncbi:MAG: hypothetical protein QNJ81_00875 [Acidimicrobiia bacterium]|nr:hypothetical protein [Acidimicrobiia bacterium]